MTAFNDPDSQVVRVARESGLDPQVAEANLAKDLAERMEMGSGMLLPLLRDRNAGVVADAIRLFQERHPEARVIIESSASLRTLTLRIE